MIYIPARSFRKQFISRFDLWPAPHRKRCQWYTPYVFVPSYSCRSKFCMRKKLLLGAVVGKMLHESTQQSLSKCLLLDKGMPSLPKRNFQIPFCLPKCYISYLSRPPYLCGSTLEVAIEWTFKIQV